MYLNEPNYSLSTNPTPYGRYQYYAVRIYNEVLSQTDLQAEQHAIMTSS